MKRSPCIYTKKSDRKPSEQLLPNQAATHPKVTENMKTYIRCKQQKEFNDKTLNDKSNHRGIALEQSVISNYWCVCGGGGLNRFHRILTSPSALVHNINSFKPGVPFMGHRQTA